DGVIRIWDVANGKERKCMKAHEESALWSAAFSPDGKWLLSGGADQTLRIWELATGQEVYHLTGVSGPILDSAVLPGGKTAVTAGDATAIVWSLCPSNLSDRDPGSLWTDLGSSDAAVAYRATWSIAKGKREPFSLLREKLAPVPLP